jgi:hypothetical protein
MTFSTWQAIAARHLWFKEVLRAKAQEWPDERIGACTNPAELHYVIRLAERGEHHEQRMRRHLERGMVGMRTAGGRQ